MLYIKRCKIKSQRIDEMSQQVNLDALIVREDFEVIGVYNPEYSLNNTLDLNKLRQGEFFYSVLRKPDFQRETNEWDISGVVEMIESFLEGDLIPSVILWKNGDNIIFVLDGAHRLSALIAWINDDYGDGKISREFYNNVISQEQLKIAKKTRKAIEKRIGAYRDYCDALINQDKYNERIVKRAKALGSLALDLQWVRGDASKAEIAYFKINKKSCKINFTETRILLSRKSPNAIASRAIIRAGNGHKYWSKFTKEKQLKIEEIATKINSILFKPEIKTDSLDTLELPIGGKNYSNIALAVVFYSINIIVGESKEEDNDGDKTIYVLDECRKVFEIINSNSPNSLGLHPMIYFYSHRTGGHQISSFMAVVDFILYMQEKRLIRAFIEQRERFERFLIEYNYFIEQTIVKYGSGEKSYRHISNLYQKVLELLIKGEDLEGCIKNITESDKFSYIRLEKLSVEKKSSKFSISDKNQIYIREALNSTMKCPICGGLIHKNAISYDHIIRRCEGGGGIPENGQITHPYCNCIYKK